MIRSVYCNIHVFVTKGLANSHFLMEPENVTAIVDDMITIPCDFYGDSRDSYWRINGTDYMNGNLPSGAHYQDGIFSLIIETATLRWNGTTFQCVIVKENMEYPSRIGILSLSKIYNIDIDSKFKFIYIVFIMKDLFQVSFFCLLCIVCSHLLT